MSKTRIYAVNVRLFAGSPRLIRATSAAEAFRFIADEMITAELASQDALIEAVTKGIKVEDVKAPDEPKPAVAAVPGEEKGETITELPAHMDRRQKAVGE